MIKYRTHTRILIILISLLAVLIFQDTRLQFDQKCNNFLYQLNGQVQPDTNIVIIHIDRTDIENLGPWPLKRSYYALLIDHLRKLKVKTIGIEIFLTDKLVSQSIYNDLLNNEIRKSGNVVLSSMIEDFASPSSGSLVYPQPKQTITDLKTGYLDYIDDHGIFIPLKYKRGDISEDAFSTAVAKTIRQNISSDSTIKLNLFSSWHKFNNYSLLEFFNLVEAQNSQLKNLYNKIILIGVSDPQIAQVVPSSFDSELPGIGLQAFALDNLLNQRYVRTQYSFISIILFTLLFLLLLGNNLPVLKKIKNMNLFYWYLAVFSAFSLVSFLLFNKLFIQPAYSFFLIPFFLLAVYDTLNFIIEKNKQFRGISSEAEDLRISLKEKEKHLSLLQKELDLSGKDSSQADLLKRITSLKEEIAKLKLEQTDSTPIAISSEEELKAENFHGIIYKSVAMRSVVSMIKKVAPADATVLILGESGTGKELVARAIHTLNVKRNQNSFVAVNCAALSDTLLESELFGHVKGAFTNAIADKLGRFEAADKGTIFLDEIGETSENFQVKLLRILQTGEFEKVGSSKTIKTDVRVIAATNRNLEQLVKERKFREDLYYRLNVIKIDLPPLRERKEDIDPIALHFVSKGDDKFSLSKAALDQLNNYNWKGNVRELESVIKRAMIFARSADRTVIKLNDLPEEMVSLDKSNLEKMILDSLRTKKFSHSSINETAKELGDISRTTVSENFRGIVFRTYFNNNFDMDKTIDEISQNSEAQVIEKVRSKVSTFLCNIEGDVIKLKPAKFDEVRTRLNSKYKNLPQKYHIYLDEIIKRVIS